MKKERVAVIDADIILYKACRVGEEQVDWGNDQWMLWSDLAKVKTVINDQISLIVDEMKAERIIVKLLILTIKLTVEEEENLYVF